MRSESSSFTSAGPNLALGGRSSSVPLVSGPGSSGSRLVDGGGRGRGVRSSIMRRVPAPRSGRRWLLGAPVDVDRDVGADFLLQGCQRLLLQLDVLERAVGRRLLQRAQGIDLVAAELVG